MSNISNPLSSMNEDSEQKYGVLDNNWTLFNPNIRRTSIPTISNHDSFLLQNYSFPQRRNSIATVLPELAEEETTSSYDNQHHYLYLDTIIQEDEEEEEQKERTRSKSTAAIMNNIWNPKEDDIIHWNTNTFSSRRSSIVNLENNDQDEINNIRERIRRFSFAPISNSTGSSGIFDNSNSLLNNNNNNNNNGSFSFLRRHSLAGPPNNTMITDNLMNELAIRESTSTGNDIMMKVDDMGKGTRLDSEILNKGDTIFYVIEFKGGRSDVYYSTLALKKDDLVIVEADRGRDLGKITMENISRDQLEKYYTLLKNTNNQTNEIKSYLPSEIYIKSIFRLARSEEITLLMAKNQDETKALMVCQSKIKQKKLNMQVVDAEYQWDRRKLTFYFVAEKRVDFRELVRELFKLYKTRIWMCAANSIIHLQEN